ncbi:hypothetical protein PFICI_00868 [Pestalotiopsis fici W106-1]|uniref:Uncharacterized protein n=1 Tax=Pestalotiopsis fici (strain W106-1 / CGMCC3.15140) TaxID=1229662 RepID=W3XM41_PESFW|nr:uncharacterized protein PFICI_00868 [Pestalotiopsis fici W106-1]ETS87040.1 hypothetical protein PFICI_00868 [Pestalotiopsis fici W106-1]
MKSPALLALAALGACPGLAAAQLYSIFTSVITECDAEDVYPTEVYPVETAQYSDGVYTTSYPILCPTGATTQTYTITETYAGASSLPTFAEPTTTPYGFTTSHAVCDVCGEQPITTTITCPSGGATYIAATTDAYDTEAPVYPTTGKNATANHPAATSKSHAEGETSTGTITKTLAPEQSSSGYHAEKPTQTGSADATYKASTKSADAENTSGYKAQSTKPVTVSGASETSGRSISLLIFIGSVIALF